jgi:hypothetical protein
MVATFDKDEDSGGWRKAVIYIDNVKKCGRILLRKNGLPEREPESGDISKCRGFIARLASQEYFDRRNCGDDSHGNDACSSGTWDNSKIKADCSGDGVTFTQYATEDESPWNMDGVDAPTFSRPLSTRRSNYVSYRTRYNVRGEQYKGISMRSRDGWGVGPDCVKKPDTYGGTCKNKDVNTNQYGEVICGSSGRVRRDGQGQSGWRARMERR